MYNLYIHLYGDGFDEMYSALAGSVQKQKKRAFSFQKRLSWLIWCIMAQGERCALPGAIVGAFAPGRLQSNRTLCRCTDAANGQMLDIF